MDFMNLPPFCLFCSILIWKMWIVSWFWLILILLILICVNYTFTCDFLLTYFLNLPLSPESECVTLTDLCSILCFLLSFFSCTKQVQVSFKSTSEVVVKDMEILKCYVIEPSLGEQGEIIASIPVKISVKAVFCKWVFSWYFSY